MDNYELGESGFPRSLLRAMPLPQALVIFVDIRGFTKWADKSEVAPHLQEFIKAFMALLRTQFGARDGERFAVIKPLGDGAMIVRQLLEPDKVTTVLRDALARVENVDGGFSLLCDRFGRRHGVNTSLRLGWGIVRGDVTPLTKRNTDFTGPNLNKASRLCSIAKPWGVAIDVDDFKKPNEEYVKPRRTLDGLGRVDAWVTQRIAESFLRREVLHECPEVHVAGVCIDLHANEPAVLIAKRARDRELFPGRYEGCGGQLAHGETFAEGVARHFKGDFGITVKVHKDIHCLYEIPCTGGVIPGMRFLCERLGEGIPRKGKNHDTVDFLPLSELRRRPDGDFIDGLRAEAVDLIDRFLARRERVLDT